MSLHCNGADSYLFVNSTEIHKFKSKVSEIIANSLCLENISKDWSINSMKKTGLKGFAYDFSVDYDYISTSDILDIHKYLMEKNKIKKYVHTFLKDTSRFATYENVQIYQ